MNNLDSFGYNRCMFNFPFGYFRLVDSRDIMELELKQHNCEVVIRKKRSFMVMMQSPQPQAMYQSLPPPP
ncbi:hypothetical protein HanRHA438_Chr12g0567141 [Helianthus annuus]|nr:hypothetical protein HanHA300_Chr12g0455501 [Helianthus annuus]KAJ0494646.1 hypothetical protein HanIR_Chr12g0599811 [Helianthus annuus]KAJ0506359.1 hypothetical protein HanHA89_Chr12g0481071 [Helianthus annuus]KAJ0676035.1 hypothetical protein HanLR1_Chr12g0458041 [Helianthus annuus]KAJ0679277.1 hypothetical protein HanOQP8_Chr12g0457561 [Helianthus annuus]